MSKKMMILLLLYVYLLQAVLYRTKSGTMDLQRYL